MKSLIFGAVLCAAAFPALAQTNVSVSVGQPGFYGRIDIGDYVPRPVVYAPQPVIITPAPQYIAEPVYLRVPPGHEKHWSKHCREYNACGVPVYFIRDTYYQQHYVVQEPPRVVNGQRVMVVQERDEDRGPGNGHGNGRGHGRGHGKHDD